MGVRSLFQSAASIVAKIAAQVHTASGFVASSASPQVNVIRMPVAESYAPPFFLNVVEADINDDASGTIDSATAGTFVDAARTEAANHWAGYYISTTGGTGSGQHRRILTSTALGAFTIRPNWTVTPDNTTTYTIQRKDQILQLGHNADRSSNYDINDHSWYRQTESFFGFGGNNFCEEFVQFVPPGGADIYRPHFIGFNVATKAAHHYIVGDVSFFSNGTTSTVVEMMEWIASTGSMWIAGDFEAGGTLTGTDLNETYRRTVNLQRTIPTVTNDVVQIGSWDQQSSQGAGQFDITVTVMSAGWAQTKRYAAGVFYHATAGAWQKMFPISTTGIYGGAEDFDVDINSNAYTASFRIRRTAGSTAGVATVTIARHGLETAFVPSTATASVAAPGTTFSRTKLTVTGSRGGNAALASLLTQLQTAGLITDSSS
jgi:hypothetical protein